MEKKMLNYKDVIMVANIGIIYIVVGILYIGCCVIDGPDIKPKLKKLIGIKLYNISKKFYNVPKLIDIPSLPVEYVKFDADKIAYTIRISELEKLECGPIYTENDLIEHRIDILKENICKHIKENNYINIDVHEDFYNPCATIVNGYIYVNKKS